MGELWFIGAGLGDDRDLTVRGLEALRRCDRIFAEEYTAVLAKGSLDRLAQAVGHPIERLERDAVESGAAVLQALAGSSRVALLVTGDPFVATTHIALRVEVEAAGHPWRYVPNASVATAAAGLLGLQSYRFGRTVSLPFPAPGFAPTSPLDGIRGNRAQRLHTLVLLDLRPSEGAFLTANEALRLLGERDPEGTVLGPDAPVAAVARLGTESARAVYGRRAEVERFDLGPPLHAVVVPAEPLHFEEEAAVRRWRVSSVPG
ncbi:MAG TPA: diphthine synthase [Thermoplasmata archaeon]|nr:diphthine synthase [Thermoplasmata archaeon]